MNAEKIINEWFVSYGLGEYSPEKFNTIKNRKYNIKPEGGLWSSPQNSEYGWKDFCDFRENGFNNGFKFQLKPDSKVYIIDSFLDLIQVPYKLKDPFYNNIKFGQNFIDYEEMAKEYDVIWLTVEGQWETRLPEIDGNYDIDGSSINLYGWDCESLLILRKECIINVRNIDKADLPVVKTSD